MSQNQRIGLLIVGGALFLSLVISVIIYVQKNKLARDKAVVESQLAKSQADGQKKDEMINTLNQEIETLKVEKEKVEKKMTEALAKIEELNAQVKDVSAKVKDVTAEKDKWQKRAQDTKAEQDRLAAKIEELNQEIETYKTQAQEAQAQPARVSSMRSSVPIATGGDQIVSDADTQWAGVLKEKAGLEVELGDLQAELSKVSQELIEIRRQNEDMQITLDSVTEQKESLDREIRYKTDLVNNLSLDLARAKNDQRLKEDRIKEIDTENEELRGKIKQLVAANSSLEKSMVRLNQDKRDVEKRLDSTEDLIHSKINEIWDIKNSIDETMSRSKTSSSDVQLTPIVVGSAGNTAEASGAAGQIVSVNADNNFVILNVGQKNGVRIGDSLGVYRNGQYVGRIDVIQVRSEIAAADIKEQSKPLAPGDIVR